MNYILLILNNIKLVIIILLNKLISKLKILKSYIVLYLEEQIRLNELNIVKTPYYIQFLHIIYSLSNIIGIYVLFPASFYIRINIGIMNVIYTLLVTKILKPYKIKGKLIIPRDIHWLISRN